MTTRTIQRKTKSQPSQDGDGVKISRINDFKGGLDPFLMLDELRSECPDDYIGGFPSHPHRGIQTLTYVLQGGLTHKDHLEHTSTIGVGDAQWMHTGHGMIHSEMPLTDVHGLHAFQLWLNLPARDKLSDATYRDVKAVEMPRIKASGSELLALGGDWRLDGQNISGPLDNLAGQGCVAHLCFEPGSLVLEHSAPTLLIYVFEGQLEVSGQELKQGELGCLSPGSEIHLSGNTKSQALILAGVAHREPIAHYGPFVMNTHEEIEQALRDYRNGTLAL